MKKLIIALGACALLSTSLASAQAKMDDEKATLVKETKAKMLDQMKEMGLDEAIATKFVDCYAADMDKALSIEDLKALNALDGMKEGEEPTAEQKKMMEDLQPKMADLGKDCMSLLGQ